MMRSGDPALTGQEIENLKFEISNLNSRADSLRETRQ
jgi:hypothetical protein